MICAGFDGRAGGRDAVALALALGGGDREPLTVVAVVPFPPAAFGEEDERAAAKADTWDELCARLRDRGERVIAERLGADLLAGVTYERRIVLDDSPARALMAFAESDSPRVLTLGSTERGRLGRVFAGTIPNKLLSGGPCAVAVAPRGLAEREPAPPATVAVAFNGSEESRRALEQGAAIASRFGATLVLLAVVEPQGPLAFEREITQEAGQILRGEGLADARADALRAEAERALAAAEDSIEARIEVMHGDPVRRLIERTDAGVDLLVVGSRGYGPLRRAFLGSVSSPMLERAGCPTLVVPR